MTKPRVAGLLLASTILLTSFSAAQRRHPERADNRIRLSFERAEGDLEGLDDILRRSRHLERLTGSLSRRLLRPTGLKIVFTTCDQENAFYDPEDRTISMCYELIDRYASIFEDDYQSEKDLELGVVYASIFTLFHEIGHALLDLLDIPFTGREEDAVDELAVLLLLARGEDGEEAVLTGLVQFLDDAEESLEEMDETRFWDEHPFDLQRASQVACLIYGSDPRKFDDLVGEDGLPEERAESCPEEYRRKTRSWNKLLKPHLRN